MQPFVIPADYRPDPHRQCVSITILLSDPETGSMRDLEDIHAIETCLRLVLDETGVGEWDGHECGAGEGVIFIYGDDADLIGTTIMPEIAQFLHQRHGTITKIYGPPGSKSTTIGPIESKL